GLDGDELGEVVDGVDGAGGVLDLPDDYGGDLDRVAVGVVDLGLRRLLVADPGRDHDALGERVHPLQPGLADGAAVLAEQLHDTRLAGHDGGEPGQHEGGDDKDENAEPDQRLSGSAALAIGQQDQRHPDQYQDDAKHQHEQARQESGRSLGHR